MSESIDKTQKMVLMWEAWAWRHQVAEESGEELRDPGNMTTNPCGW